MSYSTSGSFNWDGLYDDDDERGGGWKKQEDDYTYCSHCGSKIFDYNINCPQCGAPR